MPDPLVINAQIVIPAEELRFSFARSSGPGGQNVNKLNTKAHLRWDLSSTSAVPSAILNRFRERYATRLNGEGELVLASERHREQARNVRDCLDKLRAMVLSVATPPRPRKPTKPSRGAVEARLKGKRHRATQTESPAAVDRFLGLVAIRSSAEDNLGSLANLLRWPSGNLFAS